METNDSMKNVERVPYALAVHDKEEEDAVLEIIRSHKTIMGEKTKEFETKVATLFGKKYGIMVNSGSSANLLAFEIMNLPKGSEVITPVLTFSTTLTPIIQKHLTPVFVDVEPKSYLIDIDKIEDAISEKTKALMIPSLLGNVPDMKRIKKIADKNSLIFIEDSCDTIGATFEGVSTGIYSDISTTSFYGSHVITAAGGGGMICVNNPDWNIKCRILRGWGRSSAVDESEDIKKRFAINLGGIPYDSKFIFEDIGYNFLPLEISAAFGLVQLKKLRAFSELRQDNFLRLTEFFSHYDYFVLPTQLPSVKTPWLGFPLTIQSDAPFSRLEIVMYLEENGIQTRPVFTGNVLRQPAFKNIDYKKLDKDYPVANNIMENSFIIGCHQGITQIHLEKIRKTFRKFLDMF